VDTRIYNSVVKEGAYDIDKWPGNYFPNNINDKNDSLRATFIKDIEYYNLNADVIHSLYLQLISAKELEKDYKKVAQLIEFELKNRTK